MSAIWKFGLVLKSGRQTVGMPHGARIVHVHEQNDKPCLWAEVDTTAPAARRVFGVFATGEPLPTGTYVGTIHVGWTVWHVLELEARP